MDNAASASDASAAWEPFSQILAADDTEEAGVVGDHLLAADRASGDAQSSGGDKSPQILQAQLSVDFDGADAGELPGTQEDSAGEWLADIGKAGLSGLGMVQELTYPIWKQLLDSQKVATDFNLSFRDISGFSKPTGHAYINQVDSLTDNPNKWKGLRLDYGPFPVKDAASGQFTMDPLTGEKIYKVGWHWNHNKAFDAFGIENHAEIEVGTFAANLGRTLEKAKPLGRAALVGGVFLDAWAMGSAVNTSLQSGHWDNTIVEGARIGGGWVGGWAAAQVGGGLGATIGTTLLPGVGTIVGGALGGLVGGTVGYFGGSAVGEAVAENATGAPHPKP
ncbi:hypothetical protein [Gloeobacter morelensis]|uniref:hypothetical protein n=1 Tax=Gloeobacter morelensis TaxID=2907343 RepID=UPI001E2EC4CB|nr:hypothetical protein [Gloeobacter morelensis]